MNIEEMYQKLLLYSNELEDRIDEINNLNEKISLALESAENRIDKVIEYIEEDIRGNYFKRYDDEVYKMCDDLLDILKGDNKE